MSKFWNSLVHSLTPYVPGEQPQLAGLVKLNTNENPYGPSAKVLDVLHAEVGDRLRLYPDPNARDLKRAIADFHGLAAEQVFVGNGSDEVLAHVFLALLKHEQPVLFPDISYSFYPVYCGLYDIDHVTVPLSDSYQIEVGDYLKAGRCGGIIFPNPNAPTGCLVALDEIERLLKAKPESVLVVDEAYIDFGGQTIPTTIPLIARYPNLLVVQTLSKSRALAGLRVGFALGHPDLIEALERVKNSFNSYPLDRLAIAGGAAAMADRGHFELTRLAIIASREALSRALENLGFEVLPSKANFIFARRPGKDGEPLALALRERGIIVRHFKLPRIDQFLRISVGTEEQCQALVAALAEILRAAAE